MDDKKVDSTNQSDQQSSTNGGFYRPANDNPSSYNGLDFDNQLPQDADAPREEESASSAKITWEASEYIHHTKGFGWILGLFLISAALFAVAIFTGAWTFAALIVVMAIAIGVLAFRPPHVLHYTLSNQGLQVDNHFFAFSDFRAFNVTSDGAFYTIMLLPTKRFMPAVNIYFAEENGERIVDVLSARLPMEKISQDPIEKLMRKIRF